MSYLLFPSTPSKLNKIMYKDFTKLFKPRSIAIVGASRTPNKIGSIVLKNILEWDFKGEIYPVNPNISEIAGLKCYQEYSDIPVIPDLAIIAVPSNLVLPIVTSIGKKGTKNIVIFTAGFKEKGEKGVELERELVLIANFYGINILGPNCLGLVSFAGNLNATFGTVAKNNGNLKFLSQSGAIATSFFDFAASQNLGFSDFVTLGNKANVNEIDILRFWHENSKKTDNYQDTRLSHNFPIGLYLESIDDGIGFINIASQISLKNPVFILKPGHSETSKKAMQSHTGSLAGEDNVLEAALRDAGIIRCDGVEDFFDLAKGFSWENAPEGPNIAIVSNAGGPAVVATDFVEKFGLRLARLNHHTIARLKKYLPEGSNIHNPIDVLGDALALRYAEALDAVLSQEDINAAIVILTPQVMTEGYLTAELIARLSKQHKKPILCSFMGGSHIVEGEKILNLNKIPNYRFPERAIKTLGKMWQWKMNSFVRSIELQIVQEGILNRQVVDIQMDAVSDLLEIAAKNNEAFLDNQRISVNGFLVNEIFKSCEIKTPESTPINSLNECFDFAEKHGMPIVLKLIAPRLLHKTEYGAIKVNLNNKSRIAKAYHELKEISEKLLRRENIKAVIQAQKQIENGLELILGIKKDPNFGHVMMFGGGGIFTEIIKDVNIKLLPVDRFNAVELLNLSKVSNLLYGYRGGKPYPISKLFFLMEKMNDLVANFPQITEIEINPLIISHDEVWAVDGKAIIMKYGS